MKKAFVKCVCAIVIVLLAGILFFCFHALHYSNDSLRKRDVLALEEEEYALLLLHMYSGETLSEHPYEYYLAYNTYKPRHRFEKLRDVTDYLNTALTSSESLKEIYTFFDPAMINEAFFCSSTLTQKAYRQSLYKTIISNPELQFKFVLPTYSLNYWLGRETDEMAEILESYVLFCNEFSSLSNVRIYYFGHLDWLIRNQGNYADEATCTEEVNNRLAALTMANDNYQVNGEMLAGYIAELSAKIAEEKVSPQPIYDMSGYDIVFFGDSMIGNYSGSLSIPGVVGSQTHANVYNCAIGGQSASESTEEGVTAAFGESLDYFLTGAGKTAFADKEQFLAETERFRGEERGALGLYFVIEYGLNDYFAGRPISNAAEALDIHTYVGALRAGVERIRQAYPNAELVLLTPTLPSVFENGTLILGEAGAPLCEYAEAVLELGKELGIPVVDNYRALGLEDANWQNYLEDGTHFNEEGRFAFGRCLAAFFAEYLGL